jgi:hypothetical protein
VTGILRLALLAPDIVEGIAEGQADKVLMLERLERPLPASWGDSASTPTSDPARGVGPPPVPSVALPRSHITEGVPGEWGVSGAVKLFVTVELHFRTRCFCAGARPAR